MTDSLKLKGENKYLSVRYVDIIRPSDIEEVNPGELLKTFIHKTGLKPQ